MGDLSILLQDPLAHRALDALVRAETRVTRKLGRQLESAAKVGARWAVIVGEELGRGVVVLRDLSSGEQRDLPLDRVAAIIGANPDVGN